MDKWEIDAESAEMAKTSISSDERALKKWKKFETAVAKNPFHHPKPKRIEKLQSSTYPKGTWRFKDEPLRVVYYPNKETKVVYPLEAGTATNISYKRRSKK